MAGRPARSASSMKLGELPERNRLGGREGFAHLLGGEVGGEAVLFVFARRLARRIDAGVLKLPVARTKPACRGADPLDELVVLIEHEGDDVVQHDALFAAAQGIDDRLAVVAALGDPEAIDGGLEADLVVAGNFRFEPLGFLLKRRGDRIVDRGGDDADAERHEHGRSDELPCRHARGARDDELEPPRQAEIARHRADQRAERQHALGDLRHAEQGRLRHLQRGDVRRVGEPAHHLDVVEQDHQREHAGQHRDQRGEKSHAEIARERAGHRAAPAMAPTRRATQA